MHNCIEHLKNCTDHTELKFQLQLVCGRFGSVARLDLLIATQGGKRQALCFLRMASEEEESRLMHELGVGRFGGDIVVVIDLNNSLVQSQMQHTPSGDSYHRGQSYAKPSSQQVNAGKELH